MEKLEKLREFLRGIPHIGHGGCAIASLAMYTVCKQQSQILYLYDPSEEEDVKWYSTNSKLLQGEGNGEACYHSVLQIDNRAIDCFCNIDINDFLVHIMPEEAVRKTLRTSTWNPLFNREKYLPLIEEFIGEKLLC